MTEHQDTAAAAASDEHAPPPAEGNAVDDGGIADFDASRRTDLYRYVTADNASDYLAVMDLFTATLLTDLSAAEVHTSLVADGLDARVEEVEYLCRRLEEWGNVVRSVRDARVATVSEYLRSRSRYQVSKLGGRVHRDVGAILDASDGAREVARELLGVTATVLARIAKAIDTIRNTGNSERVDVETLAADVTTVFLNQRAFSDSATDFYAFVQGRISRYDLAGDEFAAFKTMLLDYVELISADVSRHAPGIAATLERIEGGLDVLLPTLDTLPGLAEAGTERSPGRRREDWVDLTAWYTGRRGRSGPDQLRGAADQALGQLLSNAKRMLAAAGTGVSRRADLLKLATWFDTADTATCHRLYDAAFGAYPARHAIHGPEEDNGRAGPTTSWWDDDPVDVPLSLRERGDRSARGRTSRIPDPGLIREQLIAQAHAEDERKRLAAAELCAVGHLNGAQVSPAAQQLLLVLLSDLLARAQSLDGKSSTTDTDLALRLTATPDPDAATVIHSPDGDLTIHGMTLTTRAITQPGTQPGSPSMAAMS